MGAKLEAEELRLKSTMFRRTSDSVLAATVDATKKGKKSHAAILRRRARQREAYLAELETKGIYKSGSAAVPDHERWLPKYERSNHARQRRKNRSKSGAAPHKGAAQGGVSEKDAAKLDVVARQAARAAGEPDQAGRSTAHMTVSGGGRKAKSSKRR
jgi:signal recognition particle subunit SRP72